MTFALMVSIVLAGGPLPELDEVALDSYAREQAAALESFEARLGKTARDSLGTPYADGPLGEGPEGKYDTDPLVDFSRADCVTYVEQTVALAAADSYREFFDTLQRIRYAKGEIGYEARNHFLISDWIENNAFCIEITEKLGVPVQVLRRTISRRDFFDRVMAGELGEETPDREVSLAIVPSQEAQAAEPALPSPSLIVFIGKVDWLFALHCGLFLRGEDGTGRLYHASSKAGEVVAVDLSDYIVGQGGRYLGFSAYQVTSPDFEAAAVGARDEVGGTEVFAR